MKLTTLPKDKSQSLSLSFPVVKRNIATVTGKKSNKGRSDRHGSPHFRVHGDPKGDHTASGSKLPAAPSGNEPDKATPKTPLRSLHAPDVDLPKITDFPETVSAKVRYFFSYQTHQLLFYVAFSLIFLHPSHQSFKLQLHNHGMTPRCLSGQSPRQFTPYVYHRLFHIHQLPEMAIITILAKIFILLIYPLRFRYIPTNDKQTNALYHRLLCMI
jgi:hypothetical protein